MFYTYTVALPCSAVQYITTVILTEKMVWFSLFNKFELLTAITFIIYNRFLDFNIPKFKLKYQQFKNGKSKVVSETVFLFDQIFLSRAAVICDCSLLLRSQG